MVLLLLVEVSVESCQVDRKADHPEGEHPGHPNEESKFEFIHRVGVLLHSQTYTAR